VQAVDDDRRFFITKIRSQSMAKAQGPSQAAFDIGECFHAGVLPFVKADAGADEELMALVKLRTTRRYPRISQPVIGRHLAGG